MRINDPSRTTATTTASDDYLLLDGTTNGTRNYAMTNISKVSSGSGAPSSTPAKIGDIYVDTTNNHTYIAKGASSSADWIKQNGSYTLRGEASASNSPSASSTYYYGELGAWAIIGTIDNLKTIIPRSGTITRVDSHFLTQGTLSSAQNSSLYIRVNNTTDYLVSNAIQTNILNSFVTNSSLNIPVNVGDFINFKWVTPAWTKLPTTVRINSNVLVDL